MSVWRLLIVNSQPGPIAVPPTQSMRRSHAELDAQGYDRSGASPALTKKALTVVGGRASIAVVGVGAEQRPIGPK
jgi:hypothetical protein